MSTPNPRPVALPVNVEGIPTVLRQERRWTVWRYEWEQKEKRAGRWTKRPQAKTNEPATWLTFEQALSRYRGGGWDGIGFVLGDGYAGADLDHCRDVVTGALIEDAERLVRLLRCYTEVSPSGTGVKAFFRADRVGFQADFRDAVKFTDWQAARFFAVTGHGSGDPTVDRSFELSRIVPREEPRPITRAGFEAAPTFSDDDLLLQIAGSPQGDKFLRLWQGGRGPAGPLTDYASPSEADLALCSILAFWTNYDTDRVDRLFRRSDLMRPKWDAPSYRRATLARALIRRVA